MKTHQIGFKNKLNIFLKNNKCNEGSNNLCAVCGIKMIRAIPIKFTITYKYRDIRKYKERCDFICYFCSNKPSNQIEEKGRLRFQSRHHTKINYLSF